jgi:heterodisulfide reductase subunit A
MYTAKQALLYKHAVHDGQAYVFYIDIRSAGKGYEEFVQRAQEEEGILYLRGKVSKIFQAPGKKDEDSKVIVWGADTLSGKKIEIAADLVVLATAVVPSEGIKELASKLRISTDEFGFVKEAHLKLRPAETLTAGIYLAGVAQSPKDITDSVAQGSATASKILGLFSQDELLQDPMISQVDQDICAGCGNCVSICAYGAAELDEKKKVAHVNEALCEGCGACATVCPSGAMQHKNFSKKQVLDMIDVATEEYG